MTHQNAAQDEDMSMDEILASIRRYVTGDGGSTTHAPSQTTPDAQAKPKIIQLTADDEWAPAPQPSTSKPAQTSEDSLISETARAGAQKAFQKMEQLRDLQNVAHSPSGSRTMDDFMIELLKPLLKQWMDKHLSVIVERIVEREIQNALHPSDRT
jgi:uncharacterized protein